MVGERGRAHDVLASSLPDDIARSLAHHLDLPGQMPPGFDLDSYVSGFPNAGHYVVARTTLDPSAARQGMVFSHALIADVDAIGEMENIAAVFERLRRTRPAVPFASRTIIDTSDQTVTRPPPPNICDMLSRSSDYPVVIADPLALEPAISALWPRLLPGIRPKFQFRLSFGPEENGVASVHIVAVPSVTVTRWPVSRVVTEPTNELKLPRTAAGAFLCGKLSGDLPAFLDELSVDCTTFQTLGLAARALEILDSELGFEKNLVALRLVGSLQPKPNRGQTIKLSLLDKLANQPSSISAQQFLALRNLDLAPFPNKESFVTTISKRFDRFFDTNSRQDDLRPVVESAFDQSKATKDWRIACSTSLARLSNAGAATIAPLVWFMLSKRAHVGLKLLEAVAGVGTMDRALADCLDKPNQSSDVEVSHALIDAGFVRAETTLLIQQHNCQLVEALKEACQRDRKRYGNGAIRHILEQLEAAELVIATLTLDDQIVLSAAADAVATDPTLLAAESVAAPQVQNLWKMALRRSDRAWRIRPDIGPLRNQVFDLCLSGKLASDLLAHLALSPLANALDYPQRARLWPALPPRVRDDFLASTADAWAKSLPHCLSQTANVEPEQELAVTVASSSMFQKMKVALNRLRFSDVLSVFAGNVQLPDSLFLAVFSRFHESNRKPSADELDLAAQLIAERGWSNVTQELLKRYGVADSLRNVFRICANHLAFWDRVRLGITHPTTDELYDFLLKLLCNLYPSGPLDNEIWVRAGGDASNLDCSGTGRSQWHSAIHTIRNGNQVRTSSLISAMRDDFPLNDQLDYLAEELQ